MFVTFFSRSFRFIMAYVLICSICACFPHGFRFVPRSVQRILLTGKRSHKCRIRKKQKQKNKQNNCKSKANCADFACLFAFFVFSHQKIFDGWSCMAAIAEHNSRSVFPFGWASVLFCQVTSTVSSSLICSCQVRSACRRSACRRSASGSAAYVQRFLLSRMFGFHRGP